MLKRMYQLSSIKILLVFLLIAVPVILSLFFDYHHEFHEIVLIIYFLSILIYSSLFEKYVFLFSSSLLLFHILHDFIVIGEISTQSIISTLVILSFLGLLHLFNYKKQQITKQRNMLILHMSDAVTEQEMIFDQNKQPIDYRFIYANEAFEKMTGRKKEEFIGKSVKEIMPDEFEIKIKAYAPVVMEQKTITIETYNKLLNKYFSVTSYPVGYHRFISIFHDITNIKAMNQMLIKEQSRLNNVLESTDDFIVEMDLNKKIVQVFGQGILALGFPKETVLIGKTLEEVFDFVDPYISTQLDRAYKGYKMNIDWKYEVNHKIIHLESSIAPIKDENQLIIGLVVVTRNVTDYVNQKHELENSYQRLQNIIEGTHAGIWEYDLTTNEKRINDIYAHLLGYELDELTPLYMDKVIDMIHPEDKNEVAKQIKNTIEDNATDESVYYRLRHKEGHYVWVMSKAKVTKYSRLHEPLIISGMSIDVTERMQFQEKLEYYATHDALTGLFNRKYFQETLIKFNQEIYFPLSILMLDLNGLKLFNDAYGNDHGDMALIETANIITKHQRAHDVSCRIGGDEFVMILPNTSLNETETIKQSILDTALKTQIKDIDLSVSAGYVVKQNLLEDIDDLLKKAENEMYKAKIAENKSARSKAIQTILKTLTDKYKEEETHSKRVSMLCKKMGKALNMSQHQVKELELAGLIHDIGKISIPDHILKKPSKLTNEEYNIIKTHTENGYQILKSSDEYSYLSDSALYHHERYDGLGYPHGIKGNDIPYYARIISVCDSYEAMTSDRNYRKAPGKTFAISELLKHSGTQFDPKLVKVFINKVLNQGDSDEN